MQQQNHFGQIAALAGCDLLTISPDLLGELAASDAPLSHALDAKAQGVTVQEKVRYDEPAFRFAMNGNAMATDKLAEGIRDVAAEGAKLERRMEAM